MVESVEVKVNRGQRNSQRSMSGHGKQMQPEKGGNYLRSQTAKSSTGRPSAPLAEKGKVKVPSQEKFPVTRKCDPMPGLA